MTDIATAPSTTPARSSRLRTVGRWMVTFTGFPLGGLTAELLIGPANSITAALRQPLRAVTWLRSTRMPR